MCWAKVRRAAVGRLGRHGPELPQVQGVCAEVRRENCRGWAPVPLSHVRGDAHGPERDAFRGVPWPREVIVTAVRWYGRFRLSLRDVCDLLAERGVDVSPRTVLSWVHTFGPLLAAALRRKARPLGSRWYVDETYVRVSGAWAYLYRAVDEMGQVVDVLLREHRDLASARAFNRPGGAAPRGPRR